MSWNKEMDNLSRVTSSSEAYEEEKKRVIGLLETGQAKDPQAAAKWLNTIDAVYNGITTREEVQKGNFKGSNIYIPAGTPINSNTIKEIQRQNEEGEAVARVTDSGNKRTSANNLNSISSAGSRATSVNNLINSSDSKTLLTTLLIAVLLFK